MLYYIIPPFIIILSVGVLIMFLFRKMDNVSLEKLIQAQPLQKTSGRFEIIKSTLSQFGLKILEKLVHRSKLFALKFHNASNELFHSIKEKRESRMKKDQEAKEKNSVEVVSQAGSEILKSSEDDRPRVKEMVLPSSHSAVVRTQAGAATQAAKVRAAKDKLEEALIRRIAVNPRDIEAYERLGDYYLERDNFSDSLECFKQVLKLSPAHHKAKTRIRKLESMLK